MCEIATIAGVTIGVMDVVGAAGTIMGAMGAMQSGNAARAAGDYNAQIAENNKVIAERQASDALARGKIAEDEQRRKTMAIKGAQRAALGASGVALDSGSALDILGDTAAFGELDALTIRSNADREAYGYRVQGMNFEAEAGLARAGGKAAQTAGMIGAGATLLSGAAGVGDRWYARNRGIGGGGLTPYGNYGRTGGGPR
jgi:hypothetical protein